MQRLVAADRLIEAIDALNRANRLERDPMLEDEVRRIRHLAGIALIERPAEDPGFPEPAADIPPIGAGSHLPEVTTDHVTPALLRGAILRHGALLVRGLIDAPEAERFAEDIERAFQLRSTLARGAADERGYYHEFEPEPPYRIVERKWVEVGGGVLAVDSPRLLFDMLDAFESAGLRELIEGYLGERPRLVRPEVHAAKGRCLTSPEPGTRTGGSSARCAR